MSEQRARAESTTIELLDPHVTKILRGKSGMERLRLAHEAWELARDRITVFLEARHPDWTTGEIRREVATRLAR